MSCSADLSVLEELYEEERSVKKIRTVVPWYNPEQFRKVYECLYSPNIMKKRWAVDQMEVWETRCHPSLPTAIEASLILTKAIIHDILFTNEATICQEKEIQLIYSMALVRFVNLSVELHQSYSKQPLVDIAGRLGIPSWIVDLRNEASHSYTPSLPVLRLGAQEALKFLDNTYWSVESRDIASVIKEPADTQKFNSLILAYQITQHNLRLCTNTENKEYKELMRDILNILKKVSQCLLRNRKEFIEALCVDGIFAVPEFDLKMQITVKEFSDFEANPDVVPELPRSLESQWQPMLLIMNKLGAIPELVEAFLYTQGDKGPVEQRVLASWIMHILRFIVQPNLKLHSPLLNRFKERTPLFDWDRLLNAAIINPCKYTPYIFPLITCNMKLDENFLRPLMNLMAIALGQAVEKKYPNLSDHLIFTVEDLKKSRKLQERRKARLERKKEKKSIWSLAPDTIDWKNIPIGHVFTVVPENEDDLFEDDWMDQIDNAVYTYKYLSNKNDSEEFKKAVTVEQDTFDKDEQIISARKTFLMRRSDL